MTQKGYVPKLQYKDLIGGEEMGIAIHEIVFVESIGVTTPSLRIWYRR